MIEQKERLVFAFTKLTENRLIGGDESVRLVVCMIDQRFCSLVFSVAYKEQREEFKTADENAKKDLPVPKKGRKRGLMSQPWIYLDRS